MLIGGFQPFTLSDFPGKTAAILFTQGCNFRCPYCHNRTLWPMSLPTPTGITTTDIFRFLEQRTGKLDGVVITGGEPTVQSDLVDYIKRVKKMGFKVKLDSNGSSPETIELLVGEKLVDYIAMDMKAPLIKYDLLCGISIDTDLIEASVKIIAASGISHHFRTTYYRELLTEADMQEIHHLLPRQSRFVVQQFKPAEQQIPITIGSFGRNAL